MISRALRSLLTLLVLAVAWPASADLLKQSTARSRVVFMADSSDHVTGKTGLTLTITASKDGASFASISPTVTELASGWYKLALTTSHTDTLGDLALHITGTGADPTDLNDQVVADLPGASVSSVSGAVGSVTGNVGGNVVGSVASVTNISAQTGDSYARLGAPAGASVSADIAAAKVDTAAIKLKTDSLTFTVANQADVNVVDWKGSAAPAMTGDAFARLGAPAGASVSADLAAVKAVLPSALTSGGRMKSSVEAILDTSFTEGASGRIAAGFKQFFNIASPAATMDHLVLVDTATTATAATSVTNPVTVGTNNDKTGYRLSATGVDDVWDEAQSGHTTVGTFGKFLDAEISGISGGGGGSLTAAQVWDYATASIVTAGSIGKLVKDDLDAAMSTRLASASYTAPDNTSITGIKTQTDKFVFTVTNQVDANVLDWKSSTAPAMTGDSFARLGAPAGASVSVDLAAIKAVDDAVKAKTDNLPASPAATSDVPTAAAIRSELDSNSTKLAHLDADVSTRLPSSSYTAPLTAAGTRTAVGLASANLDTQIAGVQSDTDDIQARLPAALTGAGNLKSDAQVVSDKTGYGLTSAYDAAKTAAAAGAAMALTSGERTATAGVIWNSLTSGFSTSGSFGKLFIDDIDAAISSRGTSTYAGVDTSGTTTLLARLTSGRASLLDNLDAPVSTRSVYAGGDTAGTTTLLGRLTNTRAGLIDNLDVLLSTRSTFNVASDQVIVATVNDKGGYSLALDTLAPMPTAVVLADAGNSTTKAKTGSWAGIPAGEDAVNNFPSYMLVQFTGPSCNIAGQVAQVTAYNGTTKVITWAPARTAAPTTNCSLLLVNR